MKKQIALLIVLLGVSITLLAQVIEPPTSIWEAVASFKFFLGSFAGSYALIFFLVPTVLGVMNVQSKFLKWLFTILIVGLITLLANVLPFGYLHGLTWWGATISGVMLLLVQVGLFSWEFAKEIQERIYDKWNPVKKPNG